MIKIGDKVTWISQSNGFWKEKTGCVIAIVEPGEDAMDYIPFGISKSQKKFQDISKFRRAIVKVPRGGKSELSDYYAPRIESVKKLSEAVEKDENRTGIGNRARD